MVLSTKNIILVTLAILVTAIVADAVRFYLLIKKGEVITSKAVRFERVLPDADIQILVLGDSTAFGTGAESPEQSTAGRLGTLYPKASLVNVAQNGMKLKGLLEVVNNMDKEKHYSIILMQIGANDIIRLTSIKDIEAQAEKLFASLAKQTDKLIVLHSGDIGNSKLFPIYFRPTLSKRSFAVREIYQKLAKTYGAQYVDLIDSKADKMLEGDPATYYAADSLHLNGAGYGLWFDEIKNAL